jgi:hypothetical protein
LGVELFGYGFGLAVSSCVIYRTPLQIMLCGNI